MTTEIWVSLFAAIPPTLLALAALVASLKNSAKIQDIHLSLNSRLSQLIATSKSQGRQDERDAQAAIDKEKKV